MHQHRCLCPSPASTTVPVCALEPERTESPARVLPVTTLSHSLLLASLDLLSPGGRRSLCPASWSQGPTHSVKLVLAGLCTFWRGNWWQWALDPFARLSLSPWLPLTSGSLAVQACWADTKHPQAVKGRLCLHLSLSFSPLPHIRLFENTL